MDDGYESEEEFKELNSRILELKKKNQQSNLEQQNQQQRPVNEVSSESEDSDYEMIAGDLALYDSAIESMDEILFVKDTLESISMSSPQLFENLFNEMNGEMRAKFNIVM